MGKGNTAGKQHNNVEEQKVTTEETVAQDTIKEEMTEETAEANEEKKEQKNEFEVKYNDLYDKYLRVLAEYDNYKKRTQKEKEDIFAYAVGDTVSQLLPVIDNLERAIDVAEEKTPLLDGMQMVLKQCYEIFEKLGVSPIEAVGAEFDPNLHNAVMHIEDTDVGANVVVEQFMKGYKHKDKVIRHSMVKVAN